MTLAKVFQQDFEVATSKRLYHIDANGRYGSFGNVARFWLMKVLTMIYMMALPIYFHGCLKGMWLFVVGHLVCGELLATMFIVNHVIEGVSYGAKGHSNDQQKEKTAKPATVNGDTPMEKTREQVTADKKSKPAPFVPYNDWAAVQCQTSVNWSPGSWFWNHFSGGLSHQIEHHLFPSICHTNYYHIQDVVESTCLEYGVPYQSEPNLFMAYRKMLSHLRFLGRSKSA
jgi:fatty acid desaturase